MLNRKPLKIKTTFVPPTQQYSFFSNKKHKSLVPSKFNHDIVVEVFAKDIV